MNRLVYFERIAGSARKFYLMTEDDGGSTFTANYGRIGTTGSVKTYTRVQTPKTVYSRKGRRKEENA